MPVTASRTITITGRKLKGSCDLTLAFVPDSSFDTFVPIAWKVITLHDGESFAYTWTDALAGSRTIIDKGTAVVATDEYQPVAIGQTTELLVDNTTAPPEYHFSAPTPLRRKKTQVVNRTGAYVDIGTGFITDLDQETESMNTVLVLRRVADQAPVYINYVPRLKLWDGLGYAQSQLLDSSVNNIAPLWEGTLTELAGQQITITVKRENGRLVADGPSSPMVSGGPAERPFFKQLNANDRPYTYTVDLAFADPGLVDDGVHSIVNQMFAQGYSAKLVKKGRDTEAHLELTLPPSVSCNKAELDVIAAIEGNPTVFGKAYIKGHAGAALVSAHNGLETWDVVNPASPQWFNVNFGAESAAFSGTIKHSSAHIDATTVTSKPIKRKGNVDANAFDDLNGSVNAGEHSNALVADRDAKSCFVRRAGGSRRALAA